MSSRKQVVPKTTQTIDSSYNEVKQGELLKRAIQWIVTDDMFAKFKQHGNSTWQASSMITLVVLTAWMPNSQLTEAFVKAGELSVNLFGVMAVNTYQGMMRAMVNNGSSLLLIVWARLQFLMEEISPEHFRIGGWLRLVAAGSRWLTLHNSSNPKQ